MPTRRGWAAFSAGIGLWIGARFAGSPDLHMVAVGILAMPFLASAFVQWNRLRLTIHRHLSSVRVFPGTRVVVTLSVENKGPGTAPFLLMEDSLPPSLGKPARVVVTGIPPLNSERVSYSVLCRQRGRYTLGPVSVFVSDPFGRLLKRGTVDKEEVITIKCDRKLMEDVRRNWPFFRDRRIDYYDGLMKRVAD